MNKKKTFKLCGISQLGSKNQIVIPKAVRQTVGLKAGDKIVFLISSDKFVGIIKNDDLDDIIEYAKSQGVIIE